MRLFRTSLAIGLAALVGALAMPALRAQDAPKPPETKPVTLESVKKDFEDYWVVYEKEYLPYESLISAEERDLFAQKGSMLEEREKAQKNPQDQGLKLHADSLEAEFKKALEKHMARRPDWEKRNKDHLTKVQQMMASLMDLVRQKPDEKAPLVLRVKLLADFGATPSIVGEAARLYRLYPDERDVRLAFAQTQLAIPDDGGDPRDPRHYPGRGARFERVYELLAPIAKAEPENESVQLMFGAAACALGKNDEATKALSSVTHFDKVNPAVRILMGNHHDPEAAFTTWSSVAKALAEKPDDPDKRWERARMILQCRAMRCALPDLEAVAKQKPTDAELTRLLSSCYFQSNSFERAVPFLTERAGKNPEDDILHAVIAVCLHNANRVVEAKEEFGKVKRPAALPKQLGPEVEAVMAGDGEAWEKELKEREADEKRDNPRVLLETEQGSIALELFEDTAPNTVANFVSLVEKGFYDGIIFHRVIPSFMAQGGDPDATGGGGPGYTIKDEAGERNVRLHWRGTLSMAKTAQPDTGGSQFFICYKPCEHLNHKHAVFGRVIEGQEAADRLEMGDAIKKATVIRKRNHPYVPETVGGKPWSSPPKAPDKKDEKSGEKKDEPPK